MKPKNNISINVVTNKSDAMEFGEWLKGRGDNFEKVVSIVVLTIEILLLFVHNIDKDTSFYIFTFLNCLFCFFIWISFTQKKGNFLYTLSMEFGLSRKYKIVKKISNQSDAGNLLLQANIEEKVEIINDLEYNLKNKDLFPYKFTILRKVVLIETHDEKIEEFEIENDRIEKNLHKILSEKFLSESLHSRMEINKPKIDSISFLLELVVADVKFIIGDNYNVTIVKEEELRLDPDLQKIKDNVTSLVLKCKRELFESSFTNEEANNGNVLIKQFAYVRFAWFFTGLLYIVFILNHYYLVDEHSRTDLQHLRPWANAFVVILTLLSTYFYLVAYYVMYNRTLRKVPSGSDNNDSNSNIKQMHFSRTSWWLGVVFIVSMGYVFLYNYIKPAESDKQNQIVCNHDGFEPDHLHLTGLNTILMNNQPPIVISDSKSNQTYFIKKGFNVINSDTLIVDVDRYHDKRLTLIDSVHKVFILNVLSDVEVGGKLEIRASEPKSIFISDNKLKNALFLVKSPDDTGYSVDFIFQCITGLFSALIMCFFVGRFESMTFKTPSWILVILYFYAVIQGFLVILDDSFMRQSDFLIDAHSQITQFVFFFALLGKVILYIYIVWLYSSKRLFYYFIESRRELDYINPRWGVAWETIEFRPKR